MTSTQNSEAPKPVASAFGYELIRDVLLSELLGVSEQDILYWAGKKLARKYPLNNTEEIIDFFHQADWGHLYVREEKRKEIDFELQGELVTHRLNGNRDITFQLEAGFLAQQFALQKKVTAEAFEHPGRRAGKIRFTVKWDANDVL
ncbi:YslB family protein [Bacillus massilinigeriensis]|uniref:YslB family protein n=1 Tax=Bacillus mediterraneensis TaxID=1805474 RepID=UPI000BEA5B11|nr:YslB family protein [Bacillus mediterraneensis]